MRLFSPSQGLIPDLSTVFRQQITQSPSWGLKVAPCAPIPVLSDQQHRCGHGRCPPELPKRPAFLTYRSTTKNYILAHAANFERSSEYPLAAASCARQELASLCSRTCTRLAAPADKGVHGVVLAPRCWSKTNAFSNKAGIDLPALEKTTHTPAMNEPPIFPAIHDAGLGTLRQHWPGGRCVLHHVTLKTHFWQPGRNAKSKNVIPKGLRRL